MRKNVLLNVFLILLAANVYAADGLIQKVDNLCRLYFPAAPTYTEVQGQKNYLYSTDSCTLLVQVKPMTKEGVIHDSATLSAFYGGIVKGILRGERGTLIGSKRIDILGIRGEEMEFVKGDQEHQPVSKVARILLLDRRVIVYSFSAPYARFAAMKYARDRFFASFAIREDKPDDEAKSTPSLISDTTPTRVFDSVMSHVSSTSVHTELVKRNTLNFIISFAVCVLLLAGILYVLVRWKKSK